MGLLSPAAKAAFADGIFQVAGFVELEFSFGTERFWSGVFPLDFDGETWQAVGGCGSISPFQSSSDLRANGVEVGLLIPTVDGELAANFQNVTADQYKNRPARVILGFFDDSWQTSLHVLERRYFMDQLIYDLSADGLSITVRLETELLRGAKKSSKRLTDEQHRADFPGDLGLQYASYLASGVQVKWGTGGAFFKD